MYKYYFITVFGLQYYQKSTIKIVFLPLVVFIFYFWSANLCISNYPLDLKKSSCRKNDFCKHHWNTLLSLIFISSCCPLHCYSFKKWSSLKTTFILPFSLHVHLMISFDLWKFRFDQRKLKPCHHSEKSKPQTLESYSLQSISKFKPQNSIHK